MKREIRGLSSEEILRSREKYGDNSLIKEKSKSFFKRFLENLNDPIIKVLIFALTVEVVFTFGSCNFFEVGGILAAIIIATTVSTASEYGSERAFKRMQEESAACKVRALRDGEITEIPSSDIVVGDILHVCAGEKIQADGIVLSGSLKVDQSALNGESLEVTKCRCNGESGWELTHKSRAFCGSVIISGEGIMRAERVGASTYYGMVARDVQTETRESPLKIRLAKFASQISKIGYIMALIVALTYLFNTFVADNGFVWSRIAASVKNIPFLLFSLIHALTLMITVVVVAAPEGLPMMITVVLSANMKKMMRDGVLVKKLVGIETAGSMNILFTDKTGTLTTGKLECEQFVTCCGTYKNMSSLKKNADLYKCMNLCAKLNTDVFVNGGRVIGGNGTDRALGEFFKNEPCPKFEIKEKTAFSSERKYSSVTLSNGISLIKGAPELILSRSEYTYDGENVIPFDKKDMERIYINSARAGNRVIAVACSLPDKSGLIFISLVILKDKIRRGVRDSVSGVRRAGVQVVMLTGDGRETAMAIAAECGIVRGLENERVITSDELASMSDGEVMELLPNLRVVARALPQDKTRLVKLSQKLDLVVGMTGDGINDAPSLKLSDVGFAMGNGADIAKEAGDIILLDNSFFSINRTILYGRTIFKSIRKFITFQLIMNLAACGVSLVGQFMGIDSPITIIQMLWVNIIMDTLGGLAFSGEAPIEHYMKEKPKRRTEPILSKEMAHQIAFTGAYTLFVCILFLKSEFFRSMFRSDTDDLCFMTAFYALFIFFGIFNCFGARCERMWILSNIGKNKPFIFIMIFISVIQITMIYYGGTLFRTVPLTADELIKVVLIASTVVPFEIIRRVVYKLRKRNI